MPSSLPLCVFLLSPFHCFVVKIRLSGHEYHRGNRGNRHQYKHNEGTAPDECKTAQWGIMSTFVIKTSGRYLEYSGQSPALDGLPGYGASHLFSSSSLILSLEGCFPPRCLPGMMRKCHFSRPSELRSLLPFAPGDFNPWGSQYLLRPYLRQTDKQGGVVPSEGMWLHLPISNLLCWPDPQLAGASTAAPVARSPCQITPPEDLAAARSWWRSETSDSLLHPSVKCPPLVPRRCQSSKGKQIFFPAHCISLI